MTKNSVNRSISRFCICLATYLCLALLPCVQNFALAGECPEVIDRADLKTGVVLEKLQEIKDKYKLRAIIFGADQRGAPLLHVALGMSTDNTPASTEMHFRIGSVGWQYLTMLLLRMVDLKQIALDDKVSRWYPDYPNADKTTIRMLAASSSGFGEYVNKDFLQVAGEDPRREWSADELIGYSVAPYQKPQFTGEPGTSWDYSHTGFVMLGQILELVGGKPYATLLNELVLEPLGLKQTELKFGTNSQDQCYTLLMIKESLKTRPFGTHHCIRGER